MPWHHFTSPLDKWSVQPSFVVGEYLFMVCAAIALYHAWKSGRAHLLLWVGAIVAGTANDLIFMTLPLVDNFWQAQATVMITARLPLYIPCVYVCFMYFPTAAALRIGLPIWARAALGGLAAIVFYAPYDIVGAKFLWWTWHDTDRPIQNRLLGAPIGSTIWVITFVATFGYLMNRVIARDPTVKAKTFLLGIGLVSSLCSVLMVLQMTALQQLDGGIPGPRGLAVVILVYGALVALGLRRRGESVAGAPVDRLLHGAIVGYFVTLVAIMAVFKPESHVSTSVHQTYGPCHVEAKDITGATRYEFLCADDFDEDFTFEGVRIPENGSRWYTVSGRAHRDFARWMLGVSGLGVLGIALFTWLLRPRKPGSV